MSTPLYDCADKTKRERGIGSAARAVKRGALVVIPTDTVYGIGADAFSKDGVAALLEAKGRGRDMPVPVLVGSPSTLAGIAVTTPAADTLVEALWPGGLTVIVAEQPSLAWDLGKTGGTVAVRMPSHEVALELLEKTGPMAVSSANVTGQAPARTAREAREQLGDKVAAYLEAGPTDDDVPSTIVDCTRVTPQVLRTGAISLAQLREVIPGIAGPDDVVDGDRGSTAIDETDGPDEPGEPAADAEPTDSATTDSEDAGERDAEREDAEREDAEREDAEREDAEREDADHERSGRNDVDATGG